MKFNLELDEQSLVALQNAFNDKPAEAPDTIRIYFMGSGCSGAKFGLAFDGMVESDILLYGDNGIRVIMDKDEYASYGEMKISYMGTGFLVAPVNQTESGCAGCGGGCH